MIETVKVQVPLNGRGPALIYNRNRKHMQMIELLPHEQKLMGDDLKAFFSGTWSSVVGWTLIERVPDEDW